MITREQAIAELMSNRGIDRTEAERLLSDPVLIAALIARGDLSGDPTPQPTTSVEPALIVPETVVPSGEIDGAGGFDLSSGAALSLSGNGCDPTKEVCPFVPTEPTLTPERDPSLGPCDPTKEVCAFVPPVGLPSPSAVVDAARDLGAPLVAPGLPDLSKVPREYWVIGAVFLALVFLK